MIVRSSISTASLIVISSIVCHTRHDYEPKTRTMHPFIYLVSMRVHRQEDDLGFEYSEGRSPRANMPRVTRQRISPAARCSSFVVCFTYVRKRSDCRVRHETTRAHPGYSHGQSCTDQSSSSVGRYCKREEDVSQHLAHVQRFSRPCLSRQRASDLKLARGKRPHNPCNRYASDSVFPVKVSRTGFMSSSIARILDASRAKHASN